MQRPRLIDVSCASAIERWADQKRSMYVGLQGWPTRSIIGKLKDEGPGAGSDGGDARMSQRWPEMYRGDGLLVQRIVVTLSYVPRMTLTCYYLLRGDWRRPVREQCEAIGCTRQRYWVALQSAEEAVSSGLQLLEKLADNSKPTKTGLRA